MAKIAVMGAGAVGCYYGALLAEAGQEVVLIGRPALVEAVTQQGLILERAGGQSRSFPHASENPAAIAGADLVLFCVKSPDTLAAGQAMAPHLSPQTMVLSLQNGISNAAQLSAVLQQEVIPAVVYAAVEMAAAGHVRHKGRGELILGEGAQPAAEILSAAGIKVEISAKADQALWAKFIVNCTVNAVSALTQQPYGVIAQEPEALALMRGVMEEALAVAQAEGIVLESDFWPNIQAIIDGMPDQFSSMAQDIAKGRRSEIEVLNGELVARAKRLGLAAPRNSALSALIRLRQSALR